MNRYLLLALALFLTSNVAFAGDVAFTDLDTNADGLITTAEAQADPNVAQGFGELDVNGDGFLSQAEFSAAGASEGG